MHMNGPGDSVDRPELGRNMECIGTNQRSSKYSSFLSLAPLSGLPEMNHDGDDFQETHQSGKLFAPWEMSGNANNFNDDGAGPSSTQAEMLNIGYAPYLNMIPSQDVQSVVVEPLNEQKQSKEFVWRPIKRGRGRPSGSKNKTNADKMVERKRITNRYSKNGDGGGFSYDNMITMTILNSPYQMCLVSTIYSFVQYHFPSVPNCVSWKNCLRHSLSAGFVRLETPASSNRQSYWGMVPSRRDQLIENMMKVADAHEDCMEKLCMRDIGALPLILSGCCGLPDTRDYNSIPTSTVSNSKSLNESALSQNMTILDSYETSQNDPTLNPFPPMYSYSEQDQAHPNSGEHNFHEFPLPMHATNMPHFSPAAYYSEQNQSFSTSEGHRFQPLPVPWFAPSFPGFPPMFQHHASDQSTSTYEEQTYQPPEGSICGSSKQFPPLSDVSSAEQTNEFQNNINGPLPYVGSFFHPFFNGPTEWRNPDHNLSMHSSSNHDPPSSASGQFGQTSGYGPQHPIYLQNEYYPYPTHIEDSTRYSVTPGSSNSNEPGLPPYNFPFNDSMPLPNNEQLFQL